MAQEVFDTVFERHGRRRATGAGALHFQVHDPIAKTLENNIATILGHGRAHPCFDQLDRKSTRLNPVTLIYLVCRLLLEKKKKKKTTNEQYHTNDSIYTDF